MVLLECEYHDIMVVCPLRSGFVLMELIILSNGDITNPSFKLNVSNEVDREVILDTMEILWRSIEISKGLSIKKYQASYVNE